MMAVEYSAKTWYNALIICFFWGKKYMGAGLFTRVSGMAPSLYGRYTACSIRDECAMQATWRWGYWVPDMTVQCFDNWHLPFSLGLGVPLLVLVVVGIPLLPTFLLVKHRRKLNTTAVKLRLGFVYTSYQ